MSSALLPKPATSARKLERHEPDRVVVESTGGYERALTEALLALIALARKLLTILDVTVRDGTTWKEAPA